MTQTVLVTGAFGLVGSATVKTLCDDRSQRVVVTDLDTDANRQAAARLPDRVEVRYADVTDPEAVDELVRAVAPTAIVHLAAVIPPACYSRPRVARAVTVGGTENLVRTAEKQDQPPRFVHASSVTVNGSRNPHTARGLLDANTPLRPCDLYGTLKAEAELLVRASSLPWVVLRLGGVFSAKVALGVDRDSLFLEGLLPTDGRIQTVDVRDVARAFAAATTAVEATGEILLIGGDESHRHLQRAMTRAVMEELGLVGARPEGRPGDPANDDAWFNTDWMDTTRAQEVLWFQQHSWPDVLAELRARLGRKRYLLRAMAPLIGLYLRRQTPYRRAPGIYADPWAGIARRWEGRPS